MAAAPSPAAPQRPRTERALAAIYLILLVDVLGFAVIIPLLPFYAERFGASALTIGLLGTVYAGCQLLAGPVLGALSDRWGRRPLLLASQCGTLASFLLMIVSPSFAWLCVARALDGATAGNVSVAYAYVADITAPSGRAKAFALMSTVFGIGFIVGPSLASVLFRYGFQVPLAAAAGLSALSVALTWALLPARPLTPPAKRSFGAALRQPWQRLATLFQRPALLRPLCQFGLFALSFSLYFFGLALYAERRFTIDGRPFGPREVGVLLLATGVINLGLQLAATGRLIARFGEEAVIGAGFGAAALGYLLLGRAQSWPVLGGAMACLAVGNSVLRPALTGLISRQGHPAEHGLTMGALQAFYSLSDLVAPLLAGWLITNLWLPAWAALIAGLAVAGLCLSFLMRERKGTPSHG